MPLTIDDNDATNETLLLHEIARHLRVCFDRRGQSIGLTRAQWRVLATLRRRPGMIQSALANHLDIEPMTLARHVDRMAKAGWIERRQSPTDRRANMLFITDKVKDIVGDMKKTVIKVRRGALKGFTEKEHKDLLSYMKRMKANVDDMITKESEA